MTTPDLPELDGTRVELLAEVLRRCMGIDANDNARHDFGEFGGWENARLRRPSEVAAELLRALSDEGLTIAATLAQPEPLDVPATFPLDLDSFIAGLDSPNHSEQSRRDWCRLFFRDMQRAARLTETPR